MNSTKIYNVLLLRQSQYLIYDLLELINKQLVGFSLKQNSAS